MKQTILNYMCATILMILVATLAVIVLQVSMERSIEVECQELYKMSTQYENFFYSEAQATMCQIK